MSNATRRRSRPTTAARSWTTATASGSCSRADFNDLEFLVTRSLGELNGVKNLLALARRLA